MRPEPNYWCERGDSNPHGFTRQILSLVRLPIPPLSHCGDASTYFSLLPLMATGKKLAVHSVRRGSGCGLGCSLVTSPVNDPSYGGSRLEEHSCCETQNTKKGGISFRAIVRRRLPGVASDQAAASHWVARMSGRGYQPQTTLTVPRSVFGKSTLRRAREEIHPSRC